MWISHRDQDTVYMLKLHRLLSDLDHSLRTHRLNTHMNAGRYSQVWTSATGWGCSPTAPVAHEQRRLMWRSDGAGLENWSHNARELRQEYLKSCLPWHRAGGTRSSQYLHTLFSSPHCHLDHWGFLTVWGFLFSVRLILPQPTSSQKCWKPLHMRSATYSYSVLVVNSCGPCFNELQWKNIKTVKKMLHSITVALKAQDTAT